MPDQTIPLRLHPDAQPAIGKDQSLRGRDGPYLADSGLIAAANVALTMGMPLLLTGEPGCGKTDFASVLANALEAPELLECHIRSDTSARDLLYHYDALLRFADGQHGGEEGRKRATDARHYVELQALGLALMSDSRRVILLDEIDKAPRDLPNDLLRELDRGEFEIPEIRRQQSGSSVNDPAGYPLARVMTRPSSASAPVVVITSNVERQLPDPFLRRCVFYHIPAPDKQRLRDIVRARFPGEQPLQLDILVDIYVSAREIPDLVKKPSTAELLAWVGALARTFNARDVRTAIAGFHGALAEKGVLRHATLRWPSLPAAACLFKLREDLDTARACWQQPATD